MAFKCLKLHMENSCKINYNNVLSQEPEILFAYIQQNYIGTIPTSIDTPEALSFASQKLGELINSYSYLLSMATIASISLRELKKNKEQKDEASAMMNRKDILQNAAEIVKMQYTALSRMITIKKMANEELQMLGSN